MHGRCRRSRGSSITGSRSGEIRCASSSRVAWLLGQWSASGIGHDGLSVARSACHAASGRRASLLLLQDRFRGIEGHFQVDLTGVLALVSELVPVVVALEWIAVKRWLECDYCISNKLGFGISLVEHTEFHDTVVGALGQLKTDLLIPHRRLSTSLVGLAVLGLNANSGNAVWVLLAELALVGQVSLKARELALAS